MLIAVAIAFCLWWAAIIYGFGVGISRLRLVIHRRPTETLRQAVARFMTGLQEQRQARPRDSFWSTIGDLIEAGAFLLVGLLLFIIGLDILVAVLPASGVAALIFGPACLVAAWWFLRRWRRNWQRFAQGGHRLEVLAHLALIPALTILGIAILVTGL